MQAAPRTRGELGKVPCRCLNSVRDRFYLTTLISACNQIFYSSLSHDESSTIHFHRRIVWVSSFTVIPGILVLSPVALTAAAMRG